MNYNELDAWLENDVAHHCVIEEKGDKKNLVKIPYDDFELIEVCDVKAIYADRRIEDSEVPDGMYRYDFREGKGSDDVYFGAIEKDVKIDHAGSFITKEPLDLGTDGYIELEYDTEPNFLGEFMTADEFANTDFPEDEEVDDEPIQTGGMKL